MNYKYHKKILNLISIWIINIFFIDEKKIEINFVYVWKHETSLNITIRFVLWEGKFSKEF